ncbi:MAG: DUF4340 domain-containing protein [Clostridia bacterium]|nr:DUF4340 domain-containing protein [Clostridia bacterium]
MSNVTNNEKKRMKKQVRNLLVMICVLIVLGAGLALLIFNDPAKKEPEHSHEETAGQTKLIDCDETDISVITVNNENGSFTFYQDSETDEDGNVSLVYRLQGYEDKAVKEGTLKNAAELFYNLDCIKVIGEVENPADFGIDRSVFTACLYKNGTAKEIYIGNAAAESGGRYLEIDGVIYIASVNTVYTGAVNNLVDGAKLNIPKLTKGEGDGAEEYSLLESLKISGEMFTQDIVLEYDEESGKVFMTAPMKTEVPQEKIDELAEDFASVSTSSTAVVNPTEEELKSCGLDKPQAVAEFVLNNESHVIKLGNTEENKYYCMIDDDSSVYLVVKGQVASWAESGVMDFHSPTVGSENFDEISEIVLTVNGKSFDIVNTREADENSSTDEVEYYSYESTVNGQASVYEECRWLTKYLLEAAILNTDEEVPAGDAIITAKISRYEGEGVKTLEIFPSESNAKYIVHVDGVFYGNIRNTSLDDFFTKLDDFMFYAN